MSSRRGCRRGDVELTALGAESDAMAPDHVKVHAPGINRVAAEAARQGAGRLGYRLFQRWRSFAALLVPGLVPGQPGLRGCHVLPPHVGMRRFQNWAPLVSLPLMASLRFGQNG
jgi:hypothetical protein